LLGCLAYQFVLAPPPESVEISGQIMPYITFTVADTYAEECRKVVRGLVEAWGRRVGQIGIYDYAYGSGYVLPRIYRHVLQEALQHGLKHGLKGVFAEVSPNWGLDAPRVYLTAALWWDPHADVDAIFDDWNRRMFREAAEPMKRYFMRCERAWMEYDGFWERNESKGEFDTFMRTPILEVYTPKVLAECTASLDEAAQVARNKIVKRRLRFFRKTWEVGLLFARQYWPPRGLRDLISQDAPIEDAARALRELPDTMELADYRAAIGQLIAEEPLSLAPVKAHWLPIPGCRTASWIQGYKPAAWDRVTPWFAARLTAAAIDRAGSEGTLRAERIRAAAEERASRVLPEDGTSGCRKAVQDIRTMVRKVVAAARTAPAPRIDGILNDEAWSRAGQLSDFSIRGSNLMPSQYATIGRAIQDGKNLYVAVECPRLTRSARLPDIAGHIKMAHEWYVFGPVGKDDPVLPVPVLQAIPDEIEVGGRTLRPKRLAPEGSRINLRETFPTATYWTCYVFVRLDSPKDQDVTLGMGADWWMQVWVDGREVFNNTENEAGNRKWPIEISNYLVGLHLTKGSHILAVRFISGRASSYLALGGPDDLRELPHTTWAPVPRELVIAAPRGDGSERIAAGDHIGVFLRHADESDGWVRVLANPAGACLAERHEGGAAGRNRPFEIECAARIEPDRWAVEMLIPLASTGVSLEDAQLMRMNVVRRHGEVSSWFPEPVRGAHWERANLGWLVLE